jgi:hypothetical protein
MIGRSGVIAGGKSVSNDLKSNEIAIKEFNNPRSVAYMVPKAIKALIEELDPWMLGCSERELRTKLKPDELDETLRLAFWDEYTVAVDAKRPMNMTNVYIRLCSKEMFYKKFITVPLRLAYMLRPPMDYTYKMRDLLEIGHRRMREVLELPILNKQGNPDAKLIAEMVKIVALVENRVRGAVVQKVQMEQKSLNINVDAPKDYFEISDELEKIEKEIKLMEAGDGGFGSAEEKALIEAEEVRVIEGTRADEDGSSASVRAEVLPVAEGLFRVEE